MKDQNLEIIDKETVLHYISVVAYKIRGLMNVIEKIAQKDYETYSPRALSEILIRILSRFFDELKSLSKKVQYQPPEDIIRKVYTINYIVLNIIPELIEAIEEADIDQPIASIIEAYEQIGNQIRYGTQTIIHSTWEYNASYTEIMERLRAMANILSEAETTAIFTGAPQHFVIITYPKAEEQIVLRQALIAHEMGHFIDTIQGWSDFLFGEQLLDKDVSEKIIETSQRIQDENLNINDIVQELFTPWLKEIVADCLAILIMGPAYLFAFDDVCFSPTHTMTNKLSTSHPPDQLRKAIMGKLLFDVFMVPAQKSQGFQRLSDDEKKVFKTINSWIQKISRDDDTHFRSIRDYQELPSDVVETVYWALKMILEKSVSILIQKKVQTTNGEEWLCKSEDIIDAIQLQELLSVGLTPTELYDDNLQRDPSFTAIMNSGWFYFILNESDYQYFSEKDVQLYNSNQITEKFIVLQNLIAKGIESLYFKREFVRRKGKVLDD